MLVVANFFAHQKANKILINIFNIGLISHSFFEKIVSSCVLLVGLIISHTLFLSLSNFGLFDILGHASEVNQAYQLSSTQNVVAPFLMICAPAFVEGK